MKFTNEGEAVQVRESDGSERYKWTLLRKGETIDLPEDVGLRHGFKKVEGAQKSPTVTKGKIGKKVVETKQLDSERDYRRELVNIKGISRKRAEDIIAVFPTREKLIRASSEKKRLPFRDDIEKILRKKYGK